MLQEVAEGKWIAAFRRALALNGIGEGSAVAVVAETRMWTKLHSWSSCSALEECISVQTTWTQR